MKVRPRQARDERAIAALLDASALYHARALPTIFREPAPGIEPPLESGDAEREVFVAEVNEQVVGTVDVRVRLIAGNALVLERRVGYLLQLVVDEAARGRGIGRALMEAAADWARRGGCNSVELGVYEFNAPALALYRSLGYETLSRRMSLPL